MSSNSVSKIKPLYIFILLITTVFIFNIKIGLQNINPTNIDWLMQGGDWPQHQLGFEFYRRQSFMFPIGNMNNFLYPVTTNIAFTDSIPLLAIPFKLISFILPENFQYFGLWLFFNIFMQGYLAYLIFKKLNFSNTDALFGGILLQFTPALLARINHPALTAHWLILFAFYNYLNFKQDKKSIYLNLLLIVLVSLVHPYLAAMIIPLTFITLFKVNPMLKKIILLGITLLLPLLIWYIIGYFVKYSVGDPTNLGLFNAHINTFWNPQYAIMNDNLYNASHFFDILNQKYKSQYEGFAYLGLGIILAIFILLSKVIYSIQKYKYNLINLKKWLRNNILAITIISAITIYARLDLDLINKIRKFEEFSIIHYALKAASMLRANGRFIWILMYLIIVFSIYLLQKFYKKSFIYIILILITIQIIDITPLLNKKLFQNQDSFNSKSTQNLFWAEKIKDKKAIYFYPGGKRSYKKDDDYIPFLYFASKNNLPINAGYLSRYDLAHSIKFNSELEQSLTNGILEENILYITDKKNLLFFENISKKTNKNLQNFDDYYFIE